VLEIHVLRPGDARDDSNGRDSGDAAGASSAPAPAARPAPTEVDLEADYEAELLTPGIAEIRPAPSPLSVAGINAQLQGFDGV